MKTDQNSVRDLKGVGPAKAAAYEKMGIYTKEDLLYHFPRAYENRGDIKLLDKCIPGDKEIGRAHV